MDRDTHNKDDPWYWCCQELTNERCKRVIKNLSKDLQARIYADTGNKCDEVFVSKYNVH